MKIVVSSDWHGDHVTHGIPRFAEVAQAVHHTVDRTIEEGAGLYLFLGDLCDPDAGSCTWRVAHLAIEAAARLSARGINSIWLSGNHDVIEDGTASTTLQPLKALAALHASGKGGVYVADHACVIQVGVNVVCLPFTASSHAYDPEEWLARATANLDREKTIVIGHLNVPGIIPGEETTEFPRGREVIYPVELATKRAKHVLCGHYHRQQRTKEGVWIPGSLARLTFCEEGNAPGFLILDV